MLAKPDAQGHFKILFLIEKIVELPKCQTIGKELNEL